MARRSKTVLRPTVATASPGFRAKRPNECSMHANQELPNRGQANAAAKTITVRLPSSSVSVAPLSEAEGRAILVQFPKPVESVAESIGTAFALSVLRGISDYSREYRQDSGSSRCS